MADASDIEVVVFDVLGTLVDEPRGVRAAIGAAVPAADADRVAALSTQWQRYVGREQRRIQQGERAYANSDVLDREAARQVADHAGGIEQTAFERLAGVTRRLPPWADTAAGLDRLAQRYGVLGLSNAGRTTLLRLAAHAGLRWHQALSAETVRAYKPAPEVYRLALEVVDRPPERVLLVAAHAWDLRGGQRHGLRTAYVHRPGGDPPTEGDTFDWRYSGLDELATALTV
jgi:2-haloacid dehalogenase